MNGVYLWSKKNVIDYHIVKVISTVYTLNIVQ